MLSKYVGDNGVIVLWFRSNISGLLTLHNGFVVAAVIYNVNKQIYEPILHWHPSINHLLFKEQQVLHRMTQGKIRPKTD